MSRANYCFSPTSNLFYLLTRQTEPLLLGMAKVTGVVMVSIKFYYKGGTMGLKVGTVKPRFTGPLGGKRKGPVNRERKIATKIQSAKGLK